jgi:hypothetical protein
VRLSIQSPDFWNQERKPPHTSSAKSEAISMQWSSTQSIMDYTTVPVGLRIEGQIWTGQATTVTALCPKCGRIGVVSVMQDDKRITVHKGRVTGDRLVGIDYCELLISARHDTSATSD